MVAWGADDITSVDLKNGKKIFIVSGCASCHSSKKRRGVGWWIGRSPADFPIDPSDKARDWRQLKPCAY